MADPSSTPRAAFWFQVVYGPGGLGAFLPPESSAPDTPYQSPAERKYSAAKGWLAENLDKGGFAAAVTRMIIVLALADHDLEPLTMVRAWHTLRQSPRMDNYSGAQVQAIGKVQCFRLYLDRAAAVAALPRLLPDDAERRAALDLARQVALGGATPNPFLGAELAVTYLNEKSKPYVAPLAEQLGAPICMPCDVSQEGSLEAVFAAIEQRWGRLDFALHSIAFAPKDDLQGRLVDSSKAGFLLAMDISCHSFLRMARLAEPLMSGGGALFAMSYYGSEKVIENYQLMGPVKAALEASVRYVADELGQFDELMARVAERAPAGKLVSIEDVGFATAILAVDAARLITGEVTYVDGGYHVMG